MFPSDIPVSSCPSQGSLIQMRLKPWIKKVVTCMESPFMRHRQDPQLAGLRLELLLAKHDLAIAKRRTRKALAKARYWRQAGEELWQNYLHDMRG